MILGSRATGCWFWIACLVFGCGDDGDGNGAAGPVVTGTTGDPLGSTSSVDDTISSSVAVTTASGSGASEAASNTASDAVGASQVATEGGVSTGSTSSSASVGDSTISTGSQSVTTSVGGASANSSTTQGGDGGDGDGAGGGLTSAVAATTEAGTTAAGTTGTTTDATGSGVGGTSAGVVHPDDAIEYGGHWYRLSQASIGGAEAETACEGLGGYLACVEDEAEDNFLFTLAGTTRPWIGLNNEADVNVWVWVNGSPVTYTNWQPAQPDLPETERWVKIAEDSMWDDGNIPSSYICEWES